MVSRLKVNTPYKYFFTTRLGRPQRLRTAQSGLGRVICPFRK